MDEAISKDGASWRAEEVARGERFEFGRNWSRFTLIKLKCGGAGPGCNEFVFVKSSRAASRQYHGHRATEPQRGSTER
ncbi:MAG TPA: hypothetical protein VIC84_01720 [Blastocatellia bacterium]|jgi:hypothetical protein